MKVRKSSVIIGTIGIAVSLALSTASAEERAAPRQAAAVGLTEVASADSPTAGVAGPDDSVWIAEQGGQIRVLGDQGLGDPVLDISDETSDGSEQGLLGLAFDSGFEHLYIMFTDNEGTSVVDEFAVSGGEIQTDTRRTLLTQEQPYANHNGGQLATGPDGYLYIGLGDGGSGGDPEDNGQDLSTLLGKVLRIDPSGGDPYGIPEDNPFVDDADARDEIWSYGLRNPWRFSFDAENGDLLTADVGQDKREEIDWAPGNSPGGENYGWGRMEGTELINGEEPENHTPPVFEYDREGSGCSVTGGFVYRGDAIPDLQGAYVYSDYCDGDIRSVTIEDGQASGDTSLGVNGGSVSSFVQGGDQELYVLDLNGTVYRLGPEA